MFFEKERTAEWGIVDFEIGAKALSNTNIGG